MRGIPPDILCIGSAHWDIIGRHSGSVPRGADVPGRIARAPGGVALNVALALAAAGLRPALLTAIGGDAEGDALVLAASAAGIDCSHAFRDPQLPTGAYVAVEDAAGLVAAVADARTLEAAGEAILRPLADGRLGNPGKPWRGPIVIDGNLTGDLLTAIAVSPLFAQAGLRIVPASPGKARRLRCLTGLPNAVLYLNRAEADALIGSVSADAAAAAAALVARGAHRVLVTDGAMPAADGSAEGVLTAAPPAVRIARVTGAGDTFLAGHILAERRGAARQDALIAAVAAASAHVAGGCPT